MASDEKLEITWYGHSMFGIAGGGITIVIDPAAPEVGYRYEPVPADAAFISHGHYDHSYLAGVAGKPRVINKRGTFDLGGIQVNAIDAFHDGSRGKERGSTLLFTWQQAGFRLAHFGDLGDTSGISNIELLRDLDIAMIPVGGVYTIDGAGAAMLAADLAPAVVLPMHYATPDCVIPLEPIDGFKSAFAGPVRTISERPLVVTRDTIPLASEAWAVRYR